MPQIHPGFRPDFYYGGVSDIDAITTLKVTANRIIFTLFYVPVPTTFNRIGIDVTATHNSNARLGIYENNGFEAVPGNLVLDAGLVNCNTIGIKEITINQMIMPGWYWLAALFQNQPTVRAISNGEYDDYIMGLASSTSGGYYLYYNYTYNVLPQSIPSTLVHAAAIPYIHLRKATQ
jgi:hypothetical protein